MKTNYYHAAAAYERYKHSDIADDSVTKHSENKDKVIALLQELDGPFDDLRVARIVAKNKQKLILDASASGENKMNQQQQDENIKRAALYAEYLRSKYVHPSVDYDSIKTTLAISHGHKDEVTGTVYISGILDTIAYPSLTIHHIVEVVARLDAAGLLKHVAPQVVERIVQVERQPTQFEKDAAARKEKKRKFEEAHNAGLLQSPQHNRTELDRDDQYEPPVRTESEKAAINARNAQIDEVIADTMSAISRYTGPNHARTYSRRDELTALFNQHMNKVNDVESAEKLQRTIAEKINSYDSRSSGGIR